MEVALFGGSFDPPHVGHLLASLYVLATEPVDELWLLPVYEHAFGKPLSPWEHRLEMCRRAAALLGERVRICEVERELGGVSRTVHTLRHLRARHPETRFALVIGTDVVAELPSWYEAGSLEGLVRLIVVARAGYEHTDAVVLPEVSSTEIRSRLHAGRACSHLVPRAVLEYAREHGLYG